ncbi:MAG: hypothetical protein A2150_04705 [Candidatus Muproteobacteria bacterium RBG_16_64_11]|uniref:SpoVT-AbrB domain-containing protein n=1 Tax=Candidatus Muproteobacteria bacterium RBG_16_64_11 TaxID=1817758 RepID=A0A1F6TB71_9PROT|nr:MAG: hypothetical protein A2150_04705 [Candidatus Muproteobacteria bacterium RBG_16_64_11]
MGAGLYPICRDKSYNDFALHFGDRRQVVIVRMTAKGVISIPLEIRRKFGMKSRTRVHVDVDERGFKIILTPGTRKYVQSLCGKYRGIGLLKSLAATKRNT